MLYGFYKDTKARFTIGSPSLSGYNMFFVLGDNSGSSKVIINNYTRMRYAPNTVVYNDLNATWWIINADISKYIGEDVDGSTKIYKHEIEMKEAIELWSYKHLPNCSFKANRYTLTQTLNRLLMNIANIDYTLDTYPTWIDGNALMTSSLSFNGNQLLSAIKDIAKKINAYPKLRFTNGTTLSKPILYFVSRIPETSSIGDVNTIFPSTFETIKTSKEEYLTRAFCEMKSVKNGEKILYPDGIGIKPITEGTLTFDGDNFIIPINKPVVTMGRLICLRNVRVGYWTGGTLVTSCFYGKYNFSSRKLLNKIIAMLVPTYLTLSELSTIVVPDFKDVQEIKDTIDNDGDITQSNTYSIYKYFSIADYTKYSGVKTAQKSRVFYYKKNENKIYGAPAMKFEGGSDFLVSQTIWTSADATETIVIEATNSVPEDTQFLLEYEQISNITISYDNDSVAQDERPYNQSGYGLDAYSLSKNINLYVQESSAETITRFEEYTDYGNIPSLGSVVTINSIPYAITNISVDVLSSGTLKECYQCYFTLNKARTMRDELLTANTDIPTNSVPTDDLIKRTQIYKDYLELSIDEAHHVTGYSVDGSRLIKLESDGDGIGVLENMVFLSKIENANPSETLYFAIGTNRYALFNSLLFVADFEDNYIIGHHYEQIGSPPTTYSTTHIPLRYADSNAECLDIDFAFLDAETFSDYYKVGGSYEAEVVDFPTITSNAFSTLTTGSDFILFSTPAYSKDAYEIPIFTWGIEINNSFGVSGNFVVNDRILHSFISNPFYQNPIYPYVWFNYVISNIPFTSDNAQMLLTNASITNRLHSNVATNEYINSDGFDYRLTLYSYKYDVSTAGTLNTIALQGKHIGIFAKTTVSSDGKPKFLFAINNYSGTSNSEIFFNVNNWKI